MCACSCICMVCNFFFLEIKCLNKSKSGKEMERVVVGQPFHRLGRLGIGPLPGNSVRSSQSLPSSSSPKRRTQNAEGEKKAKVKKMKWGDNRR